jgi:hypothetical protein
MKRIVAVMLIAALAACTPPASAPAAPSTEAAPAPALDYGPYENAWDAAEFSSFRHTLYAPTPGPHTVTLAARTDASGGETVAVYPVSDDGQRGTVRIVFVIASIDGRSAEGEVEFPEGGSGVQVEVVVENAGGRRHAGSYTLTVSRK